MARATRRGLAWLGAALFGVLVLVPAHSRAEGGESAVPAALDAGDVIPPAPAQVLRRALDNRYNLDARARIEVTVTSRTGVTYRRRVEVASKWINGRLHSMGRFTYPENLRDLTLLAIDHDDRDDDHFVWLPELRRVRRVSSAQRADLFQGTDVAFEDLERRTARDYEAEFLPSKTIEGEEVYVVSSRPVYGSGYDRVEYAVAKSDGAILETRYFKRGAEQPFKLIVTPRAHTEERKGHVIPMRIHAINRELGTRTDVVIEKLVVDPELPDQLFTVRSLSQERRFPDLD